MTCLTKWTKVLMCRYQSSPKAGHETWKNKPMHSTTDLMKNVPRKLLFWQKPQKFIQNPQALKWMKDCPFILTAILHNKGCRPTSPNDLTVEASRIQPQETHQSSPRFSWKDDSIQKLSPQARGYCHLTKNCCNTRS